MVAHGTPATLDAGPNFLKLSESALLEQSLLKELMRGFPQVRPLSESRQKHGQGKCRR
jgi:hypothetical protein